MKRIYISVFLVSLLITLFSTPQIAHAEYTGPSDLNRPKFVPNEVLVKYKDGYTPTELKNDVKERSIRAQSFTGKIQNLQENVSLAIQGELQPEAKLQSIEAFNAKVKAVQVEAFTVASDEIVRYKAQDAKSVPDLVKKYKAESNVEFAQPNIIYYPLATPNDTYYDRMWSLTKIRAPEAWDQITGSTNVLVADIDTGIDPNHPDLKAHIKEFKNYMTSCGANDTVGHGTHTAGTIGAIGNNGTGTVGLNWQVSLLILKVGCSGGLSETAITKSIDYAVQQGAKVINMSLGGEGMDPMMANAIRNAVDKGTVIVAAAGNDGRANADSLYPAADPNVITVSATGPNDELAAYSSYGNAVDVAAPGGNAPGGSGNCKTSGVDCIASTYKNGAYTVMEGTSMAAPHVTGLVGLMFAKKPDLKPAEVKQILQQSAKDLGTPGWDSKFGAGRIDAKAALDLVPGDGQPVPTGTQPTAGPTATATATGAPTATWIPTSAPTSTQVPTVAPTGSPTGGTGEVLKCPGQAAGDYDCNGAVDQTDFTDFKKDFTVGSAAVHLFEYWRQKFFN